MAKRNFETRLLSQFNRQCPVTGCKIVDVLEAAHIHPYRGEDDNHPSNGLILRCDIHTLFDLDLLGIDPEGGVVHLNSRVTAHCYEQYDGQSLKCDQALLSQQALEYRWELFLSRL